MTGSINEKPCSYICTFPYDCRARGRAALELVITYRRRRPFAGWPHQPDLIAPSMTGLADAML